MLPNKPIAIAITGASGMPYAISLLKNLIETEQLIYVMISQAANTVLAMETNLRVGNDTSTIEEKLTDYLKAKKGQIKVFYKKSMDGSSCIRVKSSKSYGRMPLHYEYIICYS